VRGLSSADRSSGYCFFLGEDFPNVLGEAISCGVRCVAMDVGDSASIIGNTGKVVAPRNCEELAAACIEMC